MVTSIRNKNLNYIQYGSGEDIVLLHGWGQNIEMMKPLGDCFPDKRITILDFPGFGESEEPECAYTIYDYVETTNLDIWVQLQSINDHIVKYYPISQCKPK